ncbi:FAD:protein FMN transferase [Saccharicrinis sp. GN24d3]|uniref:FAD:protein FMN transferase n=1 Tax=Saccharicrinis sp. GN24d3 TaxID=3458416 RepID=UPI00403625E8
MNSRLDVVLWSKDQSITFERVFSEMEKIVYDVECMLSMYHPEAKVYQLNNDSFKTPVKVSGTLFTLIEQCIEFYHKTNGYFNIGYKASGSIGDSLVDQLILDKEQQTVGYGSGEVQLDFGGIGKGIAIDRVAALLKHEEIENAFVSFGGSSILTRGRHPYGEYWPLALEDGRNTNLKLNDAAVSISGFHEKENKEHVTDPKSGELNHKLKLVEVQMSCPVKAEVLSTALLVAPEREHQQIINNFNPELCIRIPL